MAEIVSLALVQITIRQTFALKNWQSSYQFNLAHKTKTKTISIGTEIKKMKHVLD